MNKLQIKNNHNYQKENPEVGQYYLREGDMYIVANAAGKYVLINVRSGGFYAVPSVHPIDIFGGCGHRFTRFSGEFTITVEIP